VCVDSYDTYHLRRGPNLRAASVDSKLNVVSQIHRCLSIQRPMHKACELEFNSSTSPCSFCRTGGQHRTPTTSSEHFTNPQLMDKELAVLNEDYPWSRFRPQGSACVPSVYSRRLRGSEMKTEHRRTCVFYRCVARMESTIDSVETVPINRAVQTQTNNVSVHVVIFAIAGPRLWNSLPDDVQSAPSLATFRRKLKTYLFRQSYPDIVL